MVAAVAVLKLLVQYLHGESEEMHKILKTKVSETRFDPGPSQL
jgi:hypothetical protein